MDARGAQPRPSSRRLKRVRVLFVTPSMPWPPDQGARIRSAELIAALPPAVELHLWWVARPGEPQLPEVLRARCASVRRFERSRPSLLERWAWPRAARWFWSRELGSALQDALPPVDLVHLDEPSLLPHWPDRATAPVCLQHHKLESVLADSLADLAPDRAEAARQRLDAERWRRLERDAAARIPAQLVCAAEDAQRLRAAYPWLNPVVIENGVTPERFAPRAVARGPHRLLLLGSLDYAPNQDGLRSFLQECWPGLRAARPDLQLDIVGRGAAPELEAACSFDPRIRWVGPVDDPRQHLAAAGAMVVPLRVGGGTRIKIAEALAMRTPVVSTQIGAEGLDLRSGEHLRIATLGEEFVSATCAALDALPDDSITAAGHARVLERYTWRALAGRLAETWDVMSRSR